MRSDGSALSWRRWRRSASFCWQGIQYAYRTQANFRIETLAAAVACLLAVALHVSLAPIVLCCALVIGLELVNTAIEAVVDLVSPQIHPLAKVAKDTAGGAVLVASAGALVVGMAQLGPPLGHALGLW